MRTQLATVVTVDVRAAIRRSIQWRRLLAILLQLGLFVVVSTFTVEQP